MKRRETVNLLRLVISIALVGLAVLIADFYQTSKNALPSDVTTIREFAGRMPRPQSAYRCTKDGVTFTVLVGPRAGFPAVPSGNPRYVFGDDGRIADWTIDIGDDSAFIDRWKTATVVADISVDDALRWLR